MYRHFLRTVVIATFAFILTSVPASAAPLRAGSYKGVFKVKKVLVGAVVGFPKTSTTQTRTIPLVARCDGNGKMTVMFKERPSADPAEWPLDDVGCDILENELRIHLSPAGFLAMPVKTSTSGLRSSAPFDANIVFPFNATFGIQRTFEISLTRVGS